METGAFIICYCGVLLALKRGRGYDNGSGGTHLTVHPAVRQTAEDIAAGFQWAVEFTGRVLRNGFTERWLGHEAAFAAVADAARPAYREMRCSFPARSSSRSRAARASQ